jgi:hypothetical protein
MSDQQVNQLAAAFAEMIKANSELTDSNKTSYEDLQQKPKITSAKALAEAVEDVIEQHLGGLELLFTKNTVATSPAAWADLVYGNFDEHYNSEGWLTEDFLAAVHTVKDDHREELLGRMVNNLVYTTTDNEPEELEDLKELLTEGGAYLEDADDLMLDKILNEHNGGATGLKIGLDPGDDQEAILEAYQQTGGEGQWGRLNTVCTKAEKHGGTYRYGAKTYQMYHDSHGASGANSNLSVTAWKILVQGQLQVVGVGHHVGPASYAAVFPLSTDTSVRAVGASPDIVHLME